MSSDDEGHVKDSRQFQGPPDTFRYRNSNRSIGRRILHDTVSGGAGRNRGGGREARWSRSLWRNYWMTGYFISFFLRITPVASGTAAAARFECVVVGLMDAECRPRYRGGCKPRTKPPRGVRWGIEGGGGVRPRDSELNVCKRGPQGAAGYYVSS